MLSAKGTKITPFVTCTMSAARKKFKFSASNKFYLEMMNTCCPGEKLERKFTRRFYFIASATPFNSSLEMNLSCVCVSSSER